ncbi:hypothetical protein CPB84DRAFT_1784122 [Gymnopilus junonius]|uniref:Mitochondrial outer membrane protein IML2 n=1 Tax=Gymnopilus junonius TaxID=109634 RepID=A0A9P5NKY7_GYMJU|nr:hypothetical protein CPB84DRAFT_1784122 [Gymnopilus junonius]
MEESKQHPNTDLLVSATKGFDSLFSNDIDGARKHFQQHADPFHLMGLGVCAFLEAALGMEPKLMEEATRCLSLSEAGTRKQMCAPKPHDLTYQSRFPYGLEWEILNADAVVLLGLTHALSESYMGYLQCMYSLNSAHSKFTKLYKTVFPNGLHTISTIEVGDTAPPSHVGLVHQPSLASISSQSSISSPGTPTSSISALPAIAPKASGFFSRWSSSSSPSLPLKKPSLHIQQDGPVEDLIVGGTAFGFGLFNLVFSLLPKKVQGLVGFLGFKHDRKLALAALSLSASKNDVHSVFAGLVLMTYYGVVLLLSGYHANEQNILIEYKAVVDKIHDKYSDGSLWILNRAKILRMSHDPEGAITVLRDGLQINRTRSFVQADMLLLFELAWILLAQRQYQECADAFIKITELNSWSHGTYIYIAAGCHLALGDLDKAQSLLDKVPDLIEKRKVGGKDLPTEVFIKKKLAFYKEKQARKGGDEKKFAQAIKINIAEEIGIFWNNHSRISASIAQIHVDEMLNMSPPVSFSKLAAETVASAKTSRSGTPLSAKFKLPGSSTSGSSLILPHDMLLDLDTPDELAVRALLLGINYRTLKEFEPARRFLSEAYEYQSSITVSTWVGGVAMFELAVLDLKEAEVKERERGESGPSNEKQKQDQEWKKFWVEVLKGANSKLDVALNLAASSVDLSSRLDSRIAMLRDEMASKKEMLGISS